MKKSHFVWATYLGGDENSDAAERLVVDSEGNAVVHLTGLGQSGYLGVPLGSSLLMKFAADGTLLWSTHTDRGYADDMAIMSDDAILMLAHKSSPYGISVSRFDMNGNEDWSVPCAGHVPFGQLAISANDTFVVASRSNGSSPGLIQWFGANGNATSNTAQFVGMNLIAGLSLGADGSVYISGQAEYHDPPANQTIQDLGGAMLQELVCKFDPALQLEWTSVHGPIQTGPMYYTFLIDYADDPLLDDDGYLYVAGQTNLSDIAENGYDTVYGDEFSPPSEDGGDGLLVKLVQ